MSELLKSRDYLMKCLGFVFVFGFISLGAIGGCNNNGGGGDGGDGDGGQQPSQVASACDGLTPTIIGTNGDDNLTGTEGDRYYSWACWERHDRRSRRERYDLRE